MANRMATKRRKKTRKMAGEDEGEAMVYETNDGSCEIWSITKARRREKDDEGNGWQSEPQNGAAYESNLNRSSQR